MDDNEYIKNPKHSTSKVDIEISEEEIEKWNKFEDEYDCFSICENGKECKEKILFKNNLKI